MAESVSSSSSLGESTGSNKSVSGARYEPWQLPAIAQQMFGMANTGNLAQLGMGNYSALLQNILNTPGPLAPDFGTQGSGPSPKVTVGGVYSPDLMQQNVNSIRGFGDAQTAGQIRDQGAKIAGAGYGQNSPLAAQLATQARMGNQANTQGNVTGFLTQAAGQNAQHRLATEQAQGQFDIGQGQLNLGQQQANLANFGARNDRDLRRGQLAAGQYSSLAQQLANLQNTQQRYLLPNQFSTSEGKNTSKQQSVSSSRSGSGGWNPFPGTSLDNS